jgi:MoxR-like ATPase
MRGAPVSQVKPGAPAFPEAGCTGPTGAPKKEDRFAECQYICGRIMSSVQRVFLGKPEAVKLVMVGLVSGGHVLIEDLPGVGKTLLARALARTLDCTFKRIQFTCDMLPSDVLGVSVYDAETKRFDFKPGPIFANIVLVDEINRCPPRTQSGLLEAMNDRQVSVDGHTFRLPDPFIVLATQNPHDTDGTYPLPDSQRDRFLLRLSIGYPGRTDELRILHQGASSVSMDALRPVATAAQLIEIQAAVRQVRMDDSVQQYLLTLVQQTRNHSELAFGVSPRGALMLATGCRAMALLAGRRYCLPDDVKRLVQPVLAHRLLLRSGGGCAADEEIATILDDIVRQTPVPL